MSRWVKRLAFLPFLFLALQSHQSWAGGKCKAMFADFKAKRTEHSAFATSDGNFPDDAHRGKWTCVMSVRPELKDAKKAAMELCRKAAARYKDSTGCTIVASY